VGFLDARGNLTITDRLKDMYICGGFNVYPAEVEQALASHPAVLEAAVVGRPDERYGERPVAFVRLAAGSATTEAEIIEHVRGRLAHFKAPSEVKFLDELPRTATGKVQKFQLREQLTSALTAPARPGGEENGF